MAYADQQTVLQICQNTVSNPGGMFTVASTTCDAKIDAALGNYFYWPFSSTDVLLNDPPPAFVSVMANWLTAAIIESMQYAQVQGFSDVSLNDGSSNTTYGRYCYYQYNCMMRDLIRGAALVSSLVRYSSMGMTPANRKFRLTKGLAEDVPFQSDGVSFKEN